MPPTASSSAAYLLLINESEEPRTIVGARSDVANTVEIHESLEVDGMSQMRMRDRIELGPGARVELKPAGLHLMLIGLKQPLAEGQQVPVAFQLDDGASFSATLPVRRQ